MPATSAPPLASGTRSLVGELISGKYRVRSLIGSGGTSDVYEAKHERVGATVAIKVLHAQRAGDSKANARLSLEGRLATTLKHANVCEALDLGKLPDGRPFVVMERLVGETLAVRLRRDAIVMPRELVEIMAPLLHGLAAVHEVGAIHRDLKPANVFLVQRAGKPPTTKLLDFGVARAPLPRDETPITSAGFIVGTPLYMSPEQITGSGKIDALSDIWSAGVVMYEALTGQPPFWSARRPALVHQITSAPHRPLADVDPAIPAPLAAIVDKALCKQPAGRWASAGQLRLALLALLQSAALPSPPRERETLRDARRAASSSRSAALPLGRSGLPLIDDRDGTTEETPVFPLVAMRPTLEVLEESVASTSSSHPPAADARSRRSREGPPPLPERYLGEHGTDSGRTTRPGPPPLPLKPSSRRR